MWYQLLVELGVRSTIRSESTYIKVKWNRFGVLMRCAISALIPPIRWEGFSVSTIYRLLLKFPFRQTESSGFMEFRFLPMCSLELILEFSVFSIRNSQCGRDSGYVVTQPVYSDTFLIPYYSDTPFKVTPKICYFV